MGYLVFYCTTSNQATFKYAIYQFSSVNSWIDLNFLQFFLFFFHLYLFQIILFDETNIGYTLIWCMQNVGHAAQIDAQIHNTRNRACSSAISAVPSACVCLLDFMATSRSALATTTGKPKGEDPNVPKFFNYFNIS